MLKSASTTIHQLSLGFPLVSQHNLLVRHPMRMGLYEARIFALMIRGIHRNMETLPPIKVQVKDVVICNKPNKKMYGLVAQACDALFKKELNLLDPKTKKAGSFSKVRIVQDIEHIEGTGYIQGTFAEKIKDYLLDLKEEFTLGEIDQLMLLRNANSHRFYWLLKSWDDKPDKVFKLEDFRELVLGTDHTKYSCFGQFNRAILIPVMEDLWNVGFNVICKPLFKGKTVTGLHFFFPKKKAKALTATIVAPKESELKVVNIDPEYQKVRGLMLAPTLHLTEKQVNKIMDHLYDDHHENGYIKVKKFIFNLKIELSDGKGKIHSPGAFAFSKIETEYGMLR